MGLKSSKNAKKLKKESSRDDCFSSDSSDRSPTKSKNLAQGKASPNQATDDDSACSLTYSHKSSEKSPDPDAGEPTDPGEKDHDGIEAPISEDEGDEGNSGDGGVSQYLSQLSLRPSVNPDSDQPQPNELILTDDDSDIDGSIVVDNGHLLEVSPGTLQELSTSARLRVSISSISSVSSESSDSDQEVQGIIKTQSTSENPESSTQPKCFYIPRENKIPDTKDALIKSTAFERLKKSCKSRLFSNVLTDATEHRVKSVERVWKSFVHLSTSNDWQKLLTFGEPILMNFKLIELKSSYESMIRKATDFTTCSIMFEILGEITRSKFEAHKAELFQEVATPQFIRNLHTVVEKCNGTRPKQAALTRFIENFVDIYENIFLHLDTLASDGLAADLEVLIGNCVSLVEKGGDATVAEQLRLLLLIIKSKDTLIRANSSYPFNILKEESVENNIIEGPYEDVDHYLTIHYRLMKEDFQNSVRVGVIDYMKSIHGGWRKPINYHLNIFKNVTLATHLTSYAVKYKIMFYDPIVLAKLRDPTSPHFLTGSLIILTNTNFENYYLLRAEDKSPLEREKNYIFVSMVLGPPSLIQMMHFDVLAEPTRLFEPYYRVLNVIRTIDGYNFPFLRYIVNVETDVSPPAFMKPNTKLKIDDYSCSLWEDATWPAPESIGLNPVQLDGLKKALRNELAIIQGPPGTGKTYLSKKIIEVLLQNKTLWHQNFSDGAGLIMVVCFKNQSLDQLLTGLIRDKVKVLRIGTQSKEEMLDAYNLKTLQDPKHSQIYKKMRWLLANEQKETIQELKDSLEVVDEIISHSGLIKLGCFFNLLRLDDNNRRYLQANYEKWLLEVPCDEPDFRAVENVLGEQSWTNRGMEEQSEVYQTTLRDVDTILERVNGKLDVLEELGDNHYVQLLKSAAVYLVMKRKFMEDRFSEIKRSMSDEERLELYNFKMEFEKEQVPLQNLPVDHRWALYKAWLHDLYQHHSQIIDSMVAKSQASSQRYYELEELLNMRKIAQCDAEVVGLTTTAAAKYFKMMDCLKPKIVLVEEAAEVMEAHTIASLSKYCEHLILVGDHKQLRPLTSSHIIGKEAHLDYSMYERLVKNGFEPCTLNTQYRMRPDIADLIRPAVYEELFDDPSVHTYPRVLGIDANLFFVDHRVPENVTPDIISRWNKHEAEFHLALCNYLVQQGYEPSRITILATYSEQEKYFNKEKLNYPQLEEVLMATVDSFQGKENDIILLSLVRSNAEAVIGFLAQENRINVALSRAKIGLFITGNKSNLLARKGLWNHVVQVLQSKKAIGLKLPLKCQIHGKVSPVASAIDIKALKNGGCARQCKALLPCGHRCIHMCHPLDREHKATFKCVTPCNKRMDCSHPCILACHSTNPLVFKCFCKTCPAECKAPLPCGHLCNREAHGEDPEHKSSHRCPEICNKELPCGHTCVSPCHPEDPDHGTTHRCPILCEGVLVCGHECSKKYLKTHPCFEHGNPCKVECGAMLSCGHACHQPCHREDCNHQDEFRCMKCNEQREHPRKLGQTESLKVRKYAPDACAHGKPISAGGCREKCGFQYPCSHSCDKKCSHAADRNHEKPCDRMCMALLSCGHKCTSLCHFKGFPHSTANTGVWNCKLCKKPPKMIKSSRRGLKDLEGTLGQSEDHEVCGFLKRCGHQCERKPGTHVHNPGATSICKRECGATLVCGHTCKLRCHFRTPVLHDLADCCGKCKNDADASWRAGSWMQAEKIELHRLPPKRSAADEPVCAHGTAMISDCDRECGFKYKCNHICREKCRHAAGHIHPDLCTTICGAFLDCGHNCKQLCHFSTTPHNALDKCHDCFKGGRGIPKIAKHHEINYEHTGSELLEVCSHGNMMKFGCRKRCGTLFECGHTCRERCFHQKDPKHLRDCLSTCAQVLSCGHVCKLPCHFKVLHHQPSDRCVGCQSSKPKRHVCQHGKPASGCNLFCDFAYECGHKCTEKCQHVSLSSHDQSCPQACDQILPCGHPCTIGCHSSGTHDDPAECNECLTSATPTNKDQPLIYCLHEKPMLLCNQNCPGKLACGHKCFSKLRKSPHPCSKHLAAPAHMCQKKCKVILPCGHHCSGKCHMGSDLHACKKCGSSSFLRSTLPKLTASDVDELDEEASGDDSLLRLTEEAPEPRQDAGDSVHQEMVEDVDSSSLKGNCQGI